MPPFAPRCGDALVVESAGDVSGGGDALLVQCVDSGLYKYERGPPPWILVVHLVSQSESVEAISGVGRASDK